MAKITKQKFPMSSHKGSEFANFSCCLHPHCFICTLCVKTSLCTSCVSHWFLEYNFCRVVYRLQHCIKKKNPTVNKLLGSLLSTDNPRSFEWFPKGDFFWNFPLLNPISIVLQSRKRKKRERSIGVPDGQLPLAVCQIMTSHSGIDIMVLKPVKWRRTGAWV